MAVAEGDSGKLVNIACLHRWQWKYSFVLCLVVGCTYRHFGIEGSYLPLWKVADTTLLYQDDVLKKTRYVYLYSWLGILNGNVSPTPISLECERPMRDCKKSHFRPFTCCGSYIYVISLILNTIDLTVNITTHPFGTGTDLRRQNLRSIDVRLWRLESIPALKE